MNVRFSFLFTSFFFPPSCNTPSCNTPSCNTPSCNAPSCNAPSFNIFHHHHHHHGALLHRYWPPPLGTAICCRRNTWSMKVCWSPWPPPWCGFGLARTTWARACYGNNKRCCTAWASERARRGCWRRTCRPCCRGRGRTP